MLNMMNDRGYKLDTTFFKTLSRLVSRSDRVEIGFSKNGEMMRISIPLDQSTNPGGVGSTKMIGNANCSQFEMQSGIHSGITTIVFKYKLLQWAQQLLDGPCTYFVQEDRGMLFVTENVAILLMGIEPE
jgi:hypothetical protein